MAAEYIMHHTLPWLEGATDWIVGSAYLTFGLRKLLVHAYLTLLRGGKGGSHLQHPASYSSKHCDGMRRKEESILHFCGLKRL